MAIEQGRYQRSFHDAVTLARNRLDQCTVYYSKGGRRAAYDVVNDFKVSNGLTGTMFIDGHMVTSSDVPENMCPPDVIPASPILTLSLGQAKIFFAYNEIDVTTGWDIRP